MTVVQPDVGTARRRSGRPSAHLPLAAFVAAAGALVVWAWWMGRGFGLFSDEWNVLIAANGGELLQPFNGHLTLVPQLAYFGLSHTAGLAHYGPYRALGLVAYIALGATVAWHAARRATPVVGALAGAAVLWSSAAQLTLFFPLLMNFTVPLACCVAIWLLLDGERHRDALGAMLLAVALASSAVGVVAAIAVGVELAWRRVGWRRVTPYLVPCVLWAAWWLGFHTSTAQPGGLRALLAFAGREVRASFAAFAAGWDPGGWVFLIAYLVLIGVAATRWRTFDARAASALAGFGAFVALTAIGRQGIGTNGQALPRIAPETGRYLFTNGVFLLSGAAAMAGPRLRALRTGINKRSSASDPSRAPTGRSLARHLTRWVGVATAVSLVCINAWSLRRDASTYRHDQLAYQRSAPAYLLGARLTGHAVDSARVLPVNFIPVTAGRYLELVDGVRATRLPRAVPQFDPAAAAQTDRWLIADLDLHLSAAPRGRGSCTAAGTADSAVRAAPGETVVVTGGSAPARVSLARLSGASRAVHIGRVAPGASAAIVLPSSPDPALPWRVVAGPGAAVAVCR